MVQRKVENKVGIGAEMKNSIKSDRRTTGKSSLYQEMIARPAQSIKGGGELKKKLRRSRSLKLADWNSIGSPPKQNQDTKRKQAAIKMEDRSPNYMKPTSSSDKRKENTQVSTHVPTSNRILSARDPNYARKKIGPHGSNSKSASASKNMKQLTRSSSLKPIKPSMKATGLPSVSVQDIARATCSSTLKDSKFPDYLDLHPGGTECEGTSVFKVCPYTYCSLNGHFHKSLPPLKHFISARRRMLKAQKSIKMKGSIPCRIKHAKEIQKEIDTGQNLVLVGNELVLEAEMISSPGWPHSWNEEQGELLTGDWDGEFFVEIFPDSAPDLTDGESFENYGIMESSFDDDVSQATNGEHNGKEHSDFSCEKVPSEPEGCLQGAESVRNGSSCEQNNFDEDDDNNCHEDRNADFCFADAEAFQCFECSEEGADQLSDENDCSFPEEHDMTSQICSGSESNEDGLSSATDVKEDDEACLSDETPGSSVPNGEPDLTNTALVIALTDEVSVYDEADSVLLSNDIPLDFCHQIGNPLPEDSGTIIEIKNIDAPGAQGNEPTLIKEDQTEVTRLIDLHPTELEPMASEVLDFNFPAAQGDEIDVTKEEVHAEIRVFISLHPTGLDVDVPAAGSNEINGIKEESYIEVAGFIDLHPLELKPAISESLNVDILVAQKDEINAANEQVQTEATVSMDLVQTEATVIADLYLTELEAMDYENEIPKPDNSLLKGDDAFIDAEGSCESIDAHDVEEILDVQVEVSPVVQACPDVQTAEEAIPFGSHGDLVANETMISVIPNSDLAVLDIIEEDQMKMYELPIDLQAENCPSLLLIPEATDEAVTGDDSQDLQKDIEFVQFDIIKDEDRQDATYGKSFQVECNNKVLDEEDCTTKLAEIQASVAEQETGPLYSQSACYISSGECGDQIKQPSSSVQDFSKEDSKMQINFETEQDVGSARSPAKDESTFIVEKGSGTHMGRSPSSLSEIGNLESKDETDSTDKGEKVMMPEAKAIQPPVARCSSLKYMANTKHKGENVNVERMFNPRGPRFLPIETDPDAEKVDLRHQMMDDRKNAEEWMLDYALRQAVNRLAPARKKKVALLVEAFETVMPLPKCETRVHHSAMSFTHARTIQACS